jgi:hypothetical protein
VALKFGSAMVPITNVSMIPAALAAASSFCSNSSTVVTSQRAPDPRSSRTISSWVDTGGVDVTIAPIDIAAYDVTMDSMLLGLHTASTSPAPNPRAASPTATLRTLAASSG